MTLDQTGTPAPTCQHGLSRANCTYCGKAVSRVQAGSRPSRPAARSRQRLLDDLCDLLDVARHVEVPGSSPARVFEAAAKRAKVTAATMPGIGAAIAKKAGLPWGPGCDDRSRRHEPSRVTTEGIIVMHEALVTLEARRSAQSKRPAP